MKILTNKIYLIIIFLVFSQGSILLGQGINFKYLFDSTIKGNQSTNPSMSLKSILDKASQGNSLYFLEIGSFINSNNMLYEKTKDSSYINNSLKIIQNLISSSKIDKNSSGNVWRLNSKSYSKLSSYDNNEYVLYEGYMFRYIGELFYIINRDNLSLGSVKSSFLQDNFDKWYNRSITNNKDFSTLLRIRLHMGAQWATTALFLYKITGKNRYLEFYTFFNNALKENLILKNSNSYKYYIWNSTYSPSSKNVMVRRRINKGLDKLGEIQDVTHGNHIVQYVIDSYKLGMGNWTKSDLQLFSNTLKYKIWNKATNTFSDNVDGTNSKDKSLKGSGWKQADGWMKLLNYDNSLYNIYLGFYRNSTNKVKINKSSGGLQFYANMLK